MWNIGGIILTGMNEVLEENFFEGYFVHRKSHWPGIEARLLWCEFDDWSP
jgi:hypothetical protein